MRDSSGDSSSGAKVALWAARAALVFASLAALELGVRAWHAFGGGPADGPSQALLDAAERITAASPDTAAATESAGSMTLHPFFGWGSERIAERYERIGQSFERRRSGDNLSVAVAGGSVAALWLMQHADDLHEVLSVAMAGTPLEGREVTLLNLSSGGLKQPQHLTRLAVALNAGWEPDVVLLLDGYNELVYPVQNAISGVEPFYPAFYLFGPLLGEVRGGSEYRAGLFEVMREQARAGELAQDHRAGWGRRSALVAQVQWSRMRAIERAYNAARTRFVDVLEAGDLHVPDNRGLDPMGPELLADAVDVWSRSSLSMHALCQVRGIPFLHVLQPTLHDAGAKPANAEELARDPVAESWRHASMQGYPLLRAEGAALRERGVDFIDASRIFADIEAPLYRDRCHFGLEGYVLLSRHIAPRLVELLQQ